MCQLTSIYQVVEIAIISNPQHAIHLALVCKSFQKWVTPHLYRDVVLRSRKAFDKFFGTMTSNPTLGLSVSGIWVGPLSNKRLAWRDWACVPRVKRRLIYIFSCTSDLKRLVLINLPPLFFSDWIRIEDALPNGLEYLAADQALAIDFDKPLRLPSLKWLCSIDTGLYEDEFDTLCEMKQLQNFHWCFIRVRADYQGVRCLASLLASHPWGRVCMYLNEGESSPNHPSETLELELANLYEGKRVMEYQLFHAEDWTKALFRPWTGDWVSASLYRPLTH
jgi:hypothetical protein